MKHQDIEKQMRSLECYYTMRLLPGAWAVIRIDGRNFSSFTKDLKKPFDEELNQWMTATARALLEELQAVYAYTQSDEISILLPPHWELFNRRLEKTLSVSASIATAAFTEQCGRKAHFDSRIWLGVGMRQVFDYFRWRQSDGLRCALNAFCYWSLREQGLKPHQATSQLDGKSNEYKYQLLMQQGLNFKELPLWQKRGSAVYWEKYQKEGYNPKTKEKVIAFRKRIKINRALPMREFYEEFMRSLLEEI